MKLYLRARSGLNACASSRRYAQARCVVPEDRPETSCPATPVSPCLRSRSVLPLPPAKHTPDQRLAQPARPIRDLIGPVQAIQLANIPPALRVSTMRQFVDVLSP